MRKPVVAAAVGTAATSASARAGDAAGLSLAKRLEAAMVRETELCAEEGEVDPVVIRERKLAAYGREKALIAEEAAAAAEAAKEADADA